MATAIGDAYDATRETIAPFLVRGAHRMLPDLREEAAHGARIVLLGRDAQNIGEVVLRFDPALYEQCAKVGINRGTIRNALADLELNHGRTFPELADMFGQLDWKSTITPEKMADAVRNLTTLLRGQGLPVDDPEPPHDIIIVDNGMRGTTRAALKQMYWPHARDTLVRGSYLFRAAAHGDPQPHADQGYLFNLDADASGGGNNLRWLPDDPHLEGLTFRNEDALLVLEILTSGPEDTPDRIDADGRPVQRLFRDVAIRNSGAHKGFNPVRMSSARYLDPKVFEGVLRTVRAAIGDCARDAALSEQRGGDVQELLRPGHERMVRNARAWVAGNLEAMHPALREIAGTYCWQAHWPTVIELSDAIKTTDLPAESARSVWAAFDKLQDDAARKAFVADFLRGHPRPDVARPGAV